MSARPLEISGLTKVFPTPSGPQTVVRNFDTRIYPGEVVAILGHSGCGKSTVLSIVAGLETATEGGVVVDGREIDGPGLERALVFQSPSLLPWLTVSANVMLAVRQAHRGKAARDLQAITAKYLDLAGVAEFSGARPADLSQGTQQRVAIARAFAMESRYLLLDEPFGMLDSFTRMELQDLLASLCEENPRTVLLVTHDIDEALFLSGRILLMTDGPEARIGMDIPVPFSRPRRREDHRDPRYRQLRSMVIDFLEHHSRQFQK